MRRSIQAIKQIIFGYGFDDRKAAGVLNFVQRACCCETAFAVFHGKANIGSGLIAFSTGDGPDGKDFSVAVESQFRPIFFALDGFDATVDSYRRGPSLAAVAG